MKSSSSLVWQRTGPSFACARNSARFLLGIWALLLVFVFCPVQSLRADGDVGDCTEAALREALMNGGLVTFSDDCDITLASPLFITDSDVTIDAQGFNVVIHGSAQSRIINVLPNVANFQLIGLTFADGQSTNGGAIYIGKGASAIFTNCNFVGNTAAGGDTTNTTIVTNTIVTSEPSSFTTNTFISTNSTTNIFTGEISNVFVTNIVVSTNFTFSTNITIATNIVTTSSGADGANGADKEVGNGGNGKNGLVGFPCLGGAIYNNGDLELQFCTFTTNRVTGGGGGRGGNGGNGAEGLSRGGNGGKGAAGGPGLGGAIHNRGALSLTDCTFEGNQAIGGDGGAGGTGGSGHTTGLTGAGGAGGAANGAALWSTQAVVIVNCTFSDNSAVGGNGADGGGMSENGNGIKGGTGANSSGGAVFLAVGGYITNSTFFNNTVAGGTGGTGGEGSRNGGTGGTGGNSTGGGLSSAVRTWVVSCTFSECGAFPGTNGAAGAGLSAGQNGHMGRGQGGDIYNAKGAFFLLGSLLSTNLSGGNGYGRITDVGYNLSSDKSIALGKTSLKSTDPVIGTLSTNGGLTLTIPLLFGSPARDRVPFNKSPETDQRGVTRNIGTAADIGAYEFSASGPPKILVAPESLSVIQSSSATFSVLAIGAEPLRYQWRFKGVAIADATDTEFTIDSATTTNSGNYDVVVTNRIGSTNAAFTLVVHAPPLITVQLTNPVVNPGETAVFTLTAIGDAPLRYQWLSGSTNVLTGETNATLAVPNAQVDNTNAYRVLIKNNFGSVTSSFASINFRPVIVSQLTPAKTNVAAGASANFSLIANGTQPLTYNWYFNGSTTNLPGVPSGTNFLITGASISNSGTLTVIVTNNFGAVTSAPGIFIVSLGPVITQSPTNLTVTNGASATFQVQATGDALHYQWLFNGTNRLSAPDLSSYTITNAQNVDAGSYAVLVTNAVGSVTSSPAILTVGVPPTIVTQPASQTVGADSNVTFTVTATGQAPMTYQWRVAGSNLNSATNSAYTIVKAQGTNAGPYAVLVANSAGSVTSTPAMLTVNVPATITKQPVDQTVVLGRSASFSVTPAGSAPFTYQWRFNASTIVGAVGPAYSISDARTNDVGAYDVIVANDFGSQRSVEAQLKVSQPGSILSPTINSGQFSFSFPSQTGFVYWVQFKTNVLDVDWNPLLSTNGTGGLIITEDTVTNNSARVYRVLVQ